MGRPNLCIRRSIGPDNIASFEFGLGGATIKLSWRMFSLTSGGCCRFGRIPPHRPNFVRPVKRTRPIRLDVTRELITLCRDVPIAGRQIHDTSIVATMTAHGKERLEIFDQDAIRRYGDRILLVDIAGSI